MKDRFRKLGIKSVQIGSRLFTINEAEEIALIEGKQYPAKIIYSEGSMVIARNFHVEENGNLSPYTFDSKRQSLFHEIVHAFGNIDKTLSGLSEDQVEQIAQQICLLFTQNPQLLKLFQEDKMPINPRAKKVCAKIAKAGKLRTTKKACEHAMTANMNKYGQLATPKSAKKKKSRKK